tara:strand:+ start:211364 stop:211666 length:303 start_codon:yes stop_codon:yes gene_type:complete
VEFSGSPKKYLRIAVGGSIVLNLYLYLGLTGVLFYCHQQTWMLGWKPVLVTILFTAAFARLAYRWIMRLDAQFGSGKGWSLESQMVKLPEPVTRTKKSRK